MNCMRLWLRLRSYPGPCWHVPYKMLAASLPSLPITWPIAPPPNYDNQNCLQIGKCPLRGSVFHGEEPLGEEKQQWTWGTQKQTRVEIWPAPPQAERRQGELMWGGQWQCLATTRTLTAYREEHRKEIPSSIPVSISQWMNPIRISVARDLGSRS